jgi:xylosylprotein 4-beta-galactosyltransferase
MKLGICIPYRDIGDGVRKKHLDTLIPHLEKFLGEKGIEFRCYIGHQVDDKKFNRSGTKNVAFLAAKEDGCDYVAMHDVDMLPEMIILIQVIYRNILLLIYHNGIIH